MRGIKRSEDPVAYARFRDGEGHIVPTSATTGVIRLQDLVAVRRGYCCVTLDQPRERAKVRVVVCGHGLSGDRVGPSGLLSHWTAELARAGVASVRFDYRSSGDSSGDFATASIGSMVSDYLDVTTWALPRSRVEHWVAAGISVGGVIAVSAATRAQRAPSGLLLLSSDLFEFPPRSSVEPSALRNGEFHLWSTFMLARKRLRVRRLLSKVRAPIALVYGSKDVEVGPSVPALQALGVNPLRIADCGHLFETPAARSRLRAETLRFARQVTGGAAQPFDG